jgi:transglutaminase-like putative cysteine protease
VAVDALEVRDRRIALVAAALCGLPLLPQLPPLLAVLFVAASIVGALLAKRPPALLRLVLTVAFAGLVLGSFRFAIGRDTGVAGLLAMLSLKPMEVFSRRDARSLLGFALFAPFAAFLQDQGVLTALLAIPALLSVLVAWAALVPGFERRPLLTQVRQAGFTTAVALPLALAGFWLFPRLGTPMWGLPDNAMKKLGLGDRMTPNDWLDILVDDTPALRVQFPDGAPAPEDMYWRGPVLSDYDGEAWSRDPLLDRLAAPEVRVAGATIRYDVTLEPTDRRELLLLDRPISAPAGSRFDGGLVAMADAPVEELLGYRGLSAPRAALGSTLDGFARREYLRLPPGRNPRLRALARDWAAQAPEPRALARRFLAWVQRDFKYSISVPPLGLHANDEFLFDTRTGFCEHFSSSFAEFMRAAGVPARVVTGYAGGKYNDIGDYWVVYRKDAHAWTEIWVEGTGWVRVDPTAAVAPENILDTIGDLGQQQDPGFAATFLAPALDTGDYLRKLWNDVVIGFNAARQKRLLRPFGLEEAEDADLVAAFAAGALLALAFTLWLLLRQHRDTSDPMVLAWRRFARHLGNATGLVRAPHEPPLAYAERIARALPNAADGVLALSRGYVGWRYGGRALPPGERASLARRLREYRLPRRTPARQESRP